MGIILAICGDVHMLFVENLLIKICTVSNKNSVTWISVMHCAWFIVHSANSNNNDNFYENWQIKTISGWIVRRVWVLTEQFIIKKYCHLHTRRLLFSYLKTQECTVCWSQICRNFHPRHTCTWGQKFNYTLMMLYIR
jgi:hypothetical protein